MSPKRPALSGRFFCAIRVGIMKTRYLSSFSSPIVLVLLSIALSSCGRAPQEYDIGGDTMGVTWHVTLHRVAKGSNVSEIEREIRAELVSLHRMMSTFVPDSDVSRINNAAVGEWLPLLLPLFEVLVQSRQLCDFTDHNFDVTVVPLVNLWRFAPDGSISAMPSQVEIDRAKSQMGCHRFELREVPLGLRKLESVTIDLSTIEEGYAADAVATILDRHGIHNYLVQVASDFRLKGVNAQDASWPISLATPSDLPYRIDQRLEITNMALATASDFRKSVDINGKHYSHIIDPKTGFPVQHALASVTVADASGVRADALAAALLVMGPDAGKAFAELNAISAFFIVREGDGWRGFHTTRLAPYLVH